MTDQDIARAAAAVAAARLGDTRLARIDGLESLEDGYRVQQAANAELEQHLGARVGHKIGGTTESMRRYINVPEPVAGEVFANTVLPDGITFRRSAHRRLGIETEIAVRLARSLPPRPEPYTQADAAEAVGPMLAAIELVEDRYENFATTGAPTLIADNIFNMGSILGRDRSDWHGLALDRLEAQTSRNGQVIATGLSDALYGHPLAALTWLANRRSALGLGLAAGSFVSLGSITPVQWVDEPATYRIEVEALGTVDVTIA